MRQILRQQILPICLLVLLVLSVSVFPILAVRTFRTQVPSRGRVKSINCEVFWDAELTNKTVEINWGLIEPNTTVSRLVYIANTGNAPINLTLSTDSWMPDNANQWIHLSWDYIGQEIGKRESIPVTFSLAVAADIHGIDVFNFLITITGTG